MPHQDFIGRAIRRAATEDSRDRLLRIAARMPSPLIWSFAKANRWFSGHGQTPDAPDTVFFFVTNTCNQSCVHCFYAAELNTPVEAVPLEGVEKIAQSIRGKTKTVFICGGEPTTRKDLSEVVKAFFEKGQVERVFITSNGLLRDRLFKTVEQVMELDGDFQLRIPISLDGEESVHDTIRKSPGGFKRAVGTLRGLLDKAKDEPRLIPLITTVIQKGNASSFVQFYSEMRDEFECEVQFIFLRQDRRDAGGLNMSLLLDAGGEDDLLPPPEQCAEILSGIEAYEKSRAKTSTVPLLRSVFGELHQQVVSEKRALAPCIAPSSFATIFPDGGTSLCEVVTPFSNIRDFDYDLAKCWKSEAAEAQRRELSACWCTYPCALHSSLMRDPKAMTEVLKKVKSKL